MELARTAIGLTAAVTVPTGLSWHSKQPWYAISFTLAYSVLTVAPSGITAKELAASIAATCSSVCFALLNKSLPWPAPRIPPQRSPRSNLSRTKLGVAASGIASISLVILLGIDAELRLLQEIAIDDSRYIISISGLLIAVFGCHLMIGQAVKPFVEKITEKINSQAFDASVKDFIESGPHVGWIERFILFAFLTSGNPAAAALVVTAKSLARFPEIRQAEKLVGDYYLVGTLTSVAAAVFVSGVTRMALGMPPI